MRNSLTIVLIILVLAIGVYFYFRPSNQSTLPASNTKQDSSITQSESNIESETFASPNHNALTIKDQKLSDVNNFGLEVNNVYFEKSGFIIISDIKNDLPNNIIPNDLGIFDPGRIFENVAITSPIQAGVYFAELYEDDGDRIFNKNKDKVLPLYSTACNCYDKKFVVQFSIE